jgi:ATP/maltotriose-dependent transcriptional regulator MalT
MVAMGMSVFDEDSEAELAAPALSEREQQVLALLAVGATNPEIASRLHLSPHTVKEYASALYRKLEVRGRMQAVKRAEQLGLID